MNYIIQIWTACRYMCKMHLASRCHSCYTLNMQLILMDG